MFRLLMTVFISQLIALPAYAADKPWWQFWGDEAETEITAPAPAAKAESKPVLRSPLFTDKEKEVLNGYILDRVLPTRHEHVEEYEDDDLKPNKKPKKEKKLPPGLEKKLERGGDLPPGWQKKVARGEVLDSELYAASKPLPRDIYDRLPESPEGTIIRQIDDRIVRVMEATNVIIDVLGGSN